MKNNQLFQHNKYFQKHMNQNKFRFILKICKIKIVFLNLLNSEEKKYQKHVELLDMFIKQDNFMCLVLVIEIVIQINQLILKQTFQQQLYLQKMKINLWVLFNTLIQQALIILLENNQKLFIIKLRFDTNFCFNALFCIQQIDYIKY
ncbi:unnamed protein product [Paramecium sonneborni]|uniref:Transmembrane protein n=1 Tax=Paramecium sonneborni TaxID=65129 RepID=A0A8S1PLZ4_9CILI|nr:unnamed protein product [Paramecium sonneborni]